MSVRVANLFEVSAMNRHHTCGLAAIAALGLALPPGSTAAQQTTVKEQRVQSGSPELAAKDDWQHDFTVLTMAPDGGWGAATENFINKAIVGAIRSCKTMSGAEHGCGAYFTSIRAGWSLGIRCGRENIIVARKDLADAERSANRREIDLRANYVPNMPPCARVVTIDPNGAIILPTVGYSIANPSSR
jgi:hypothetical protein